MKILYIGGRLSYWRTGGAATVERNLVEGLSRDKSVHLTVMGTTPSSHSIAMFRHRGVLFKALPTVAEPDTFFDVFMSILGYPLMARREEYDLVHFGVMPGLRGAFLLIWLKLVNSKMPVVTTIHGLPSELTSYSESSFREALGRIHWWISLLLLRLTDKVVVNSAFVAKSVESLSIPRSKIVVIPNGVERGPISQEKSVEEANSILCFGRFLPLKGQDRLIRAFAKTSCSSNYTLKIIGGPEGKYKQYCIDLIRRLGLGERVELHDFMTWDDLSREISQSSFCVFPSDFEAFGIGILESMSLGKAIIGPEVGGPRDFVKTGINGILVDTKSIQKMADSIDFLASNGAVRLQMGSRAREAASRLVWDMLIPQYVKLYSHLVARRVAQQNKRRCR